jgi:leader peptidase (prepilin peptidase)/N-methyltransferase
VTYAVPVAVRMAVFGVFGLVFGSFLSVVMYRVPRKESIVAPGSACPACGAPIRPRDNVPVVSYLLLRGRCRACGSRISPQYLMVELATGLLFAGTVLALHRTWVAAVVAPFLGVLFACAVIDARSRIVPNRIVYPSLVLFALAVAVLGIAGQRVSVATAGLALLAYGGSLFVIAFVMPAGMGMGDAKLAALIGLVLGGLGWRYVGVAVGLGILAGGIGAIVALARGAKRKDAIPFGPFLAAGAVAAALFAPQLASWYTGLAR